MSAGLAEKERQFLSTLEEDTGRDLATWMTAISAANLQHRNEIIDWLRQQGFMFSKASWLERIHHNGGRPIYLEAPPPARQAAGTAPTLGGDVSARPSPAPIVAEPAGPAGARSPGEPGARTASLPTTTPDVRVAAPSARGASADDTDLEALLASAKAYRPLAQLVLREIARTLPGVEFLAEATYVSVRTTQEIAILVPGVRELRLGLALGDRPVTPPLVPARISGLTPKIQTAITHMVVLNDARQVDGTLLTLVSEAARRTS